MQLQAHQRQRPLCSTTTAGGRSCRSQRCRVAAPEAADTHASAAADHTSSGTGAQWGRQPPQQPLQSHNRRTQGEARGSTAHSSPAPSGGGFSLWSLWVGSQHSSSSSSTSSSSGGGGVGTTAAHTNHQRAWGSRLERSAAAVTKQHAQRGLLQHHQASSSPHKPAATAPSTGVHVSSSSMEEEDAGSTATTSTNSSTLPVESLFLADLMPPAAAAALAAETPADSSSAGGQLALLLGDTYAHPGLLLPARSYRSSSSGGSAGTLSPLLPLPPAAPGASNGGDLPLSPSATSSLDGGDDWLAAVLSDPTDRLSANSNVVLTNSLRRIASLRNSGGPAGSSSAALPADAEGLLSSIRSRFGSFELVDFEEVALQLAKLGLEPDDAWLAAFDRSSLPAMRGGSPRLLSKLLLARAKLPGPVASEWCAACLALMTAAPDRASVSSWVNALRACVRLRHQPNRQFQAAFFTASAGRLDDVSPELLTHLVSSLAHLRCAPTPVWWASLAAATATAGVEKPFSAGQLASLLHSLALWAEPARLSPSQVQAFADQLLRCLAGGQLSLLQPAELSRIAAALGSLAGAGRLNLAPELQHELLVAIQGQLPRLNPGQLASLCAGLAKLHEQTGLPQGVADALLLEVQAQLGGFSDAGLCGVLWSLCRMALWTSATFRQTLWEELHERVRRPLSLQHVSTLLWSLAQLQLQPPAELLDELAALSAPHLPHCDATHLANIVWALARLEARPGGAFIQAAEAASLQVLPGAGLHQLVNIAWGRGRLRERETEPLPPSPTWQVACLRELRLRCMCAGHDVDCKQLVPLLQELGVAGLEDAAAAAAADALFAAQGEADEDALCSVQFQPGCR